MKKYVILILTYPKLNNFLFFKFGIELPLDLFRIFLYFLLLLLCFGVFLLISLLARHLHVQLGLLVEIDTRQRHQLMLAVLLSNCCVRIGLLRIFNLHNVEECVQGGNFGNDCLKDKRVPFGVDINFFKASVVDRLVDFI